jgi:hypothetical protein
VQPGVGQLGNERRDNILGPRTTNLDLSLFKKVPVWRENNIQFRSDFFDALNHPLLGIPSATVSASTYGQITSITGNRSIQLSLKFFTDVRDLFAHVYSVAAIFILNAN